MIGAFAAIRDIGGIETVRDAYAAVGRGAVDQKLVSKWLDDGILRNPTFTRAIWDGYPEIQEKLFNILNFKAFE